MSTPLQRILHTECPSCGHVFEPKEPHYYNRCEKPPREPICGPCVEDIYGVDLDTIPEERGRP